MNKLIYTGNVSGISRKEFDGKVNTKLKFTVQEGDDIKLLTVKVLDEHNNNDVKVGDKVQFEISCSTMKDSFEVFYKTNSKIQISK